MTIIINVGNNAFGGNIVSNDNMKKTKRIKYAHSCIWVILMSLHYIIAQKIVLNFSWNMALIVLFLSLWKVVLKPKQIFI